MSKENSETRSCGSCFWNDGIDNCPDEIDRGLQCGTDCFGCVCGYCEEGSKYEKKTDEKAADECRRVPE